MTFAFDPEFAAALAPMAEAMAETTPPPVGDVQTRRETFEANIASAGAAQPTPPDVTTTDFRTVSSDGSPPRSRFAGTPRKVTRPDRRRSTCTAGG
jgi:hypothetical protein